MIPIGDDQVRGARPAYVNWALVAASVLLFLYEASLSRPALEELFRSYGFVPAAVMKGERLWTLLTSMFLHGGWLHIAGNMAFLWVFGDNIEAVLGHVRYLAFYLLGGLAAGVGQVLSAPSSTVPGVGASGAIAAVLGAYIVIFPRSRVRILVFLGLFATVTRVRAAVFLGIWIVMQLMSGLAGLGASTAQAGGVAWFAHIGGFAFGLAAGVLTRNRARRFELSRPEARPE